jgi:hypothetical protein
MPGARCARSLACKIKKHTSIVTTVTPKTPGIPYAMVLTVSFGLSPVIGLVCHRRQRNCFRQLDASVEASGPHDFAVREARTFVFRAASRPPHPVPNVRDDRETPLCVGQDGALIILIWVNREQEYFFERGWTPKRLSCPSGKT